MEAQAQIRTQSNQATQTEDERNSKQQQLQQRHIYPHARVTQRPNTNTMPNQLHQNKPTPGVTQTATVSTIENRRVETACTEAIEPSEQEIADVLARLTEDSIRKAIAQAESIPENAMVEIGLVERGDEIPICHVKGDRRPYIRVKVNGLEKFPLLDSGAMVSIISYTNEEELIPFNARLEPCNMTISTVNQPNKEVSGVMWLRYEIGKRSHVVPTVVMKSHRSYFMVGIDFWEAFDIKCGWGEVNGGNLIAPWSEEHGNCQPHVSENQSVSMGTSQLSPVQKEKEAKRTEETSMEPHGIFLATQRALKLKRKQVGLSPSTHSKGNKHLRQLNRPIVTSYEMKSGVNVDMNKIDRETEINKEHGNSPSFLIRSLLRQMPKSAFEVHEIAVEPAIRTATGANDSYEDVRREKHTCVSEPHELTDEQRRILSEVRAEFPHTRETGPLNCTPIYQQKINTGNAPPQMRKQYPMSPYIMEEVKKEIEKLIERDIIEPIQYSAWRWPILWVKKKDGGGRICIDARGLNKVTVRDAYPTLKVDTILQNLPKAKFITCLDMTQAFHQIAIAPEDRTKTAFAVGHQFYCYKRATMGFTNSPADLAKVLDQVFGDLIPRVYHYVDDFIILSATFEEHMELLREVARRLREAQLTVSRKKSMFCHKKITFLGYVLTGNGLIVNPDRAKPIIEYKRPETVKELRRLIGLVGWYRRFIPKAAEIMAPLSDLTKGGVGGKQRIEWSEKAEKAFRQVKAALISPAILTSPDYSLPYKIYTDASLIAGAAVLTQVQDGEEKVIAYHSAKFSKTQSNYSATERECLAVLTGIEKFRPFIDGVEFTVVTDHASLKWLQNLKEPHGKLARWAVRLQAFNIKFEHRPGRQMTVPDALSRSVELIEIGKETKTEDKWYNSMYLMAEAKKAQKYKISEGRLYHMGKFDIRIGERRWTLCVPKERIEEVMKEQHDEAHFGYWKTYRMIQKLYYWPNMHISIAEYVRNCNICKIIKHSNENTRVPTGEYRDPERIGRVLSIDLVGPLPASKIHKHIWIIVVLDVFSKYVFAKACTRATANVIADFLEKEVFYRFDTPEWVVSDNGTQFVSEFFGKFLHQHKIRHHITPVYHPQANPVEATNKSVKTLLRAELIRRADHCDWSNVLARVVMNLNTAPRMPTGQTPHFLVFGRERSQTGNEHRVIGDENEIERTTEEREEAREIIYEQVAEEERAAFEQNKKRYNLRAVERKFNIGDTVYIKNQKQSSAGEMYSQKLAPLRREVHIKSLVEGASDIYVLADRSGKELGRFHANQIFSR